MVERGTVARARRGIVEVELDPTAVGARGELARRRKHRLAEELETLGALRPRQRQGRAVELAERQRFDHGQDFGIDQVAGVHRAFLRRSAGIVQRAAHG